MSYAFIELSTGNMVGFFATERQALEAVVDSIDRYGRESVATLGLGYSDPKTKIGYPIAEGDALAERALAAAPGKPAAPARAAQPTRRAPVSA